MRRQLTKTTKLAKNELKDIKNLVSICHNTDKFKTKLYWNILEDRKLPEFDDFLYYVEGNLAAYLGLFVFKENECELSALVHPKFRKQGFFTTLLNEAFQELKRRNIKKVLFISNRDAKTNIEHLSQKLKANYSHSEYEMTFTEKPITSTVPEIELREIVHDDIFEVAKMDSLCFGTSIENMIFRFLNNINDKTRRIWLATHEKENVGKVHVRFDEHHKAYIHDFCVLPEYRRKKIATAMVLKIMEILKKKGIKHIFLDVEGKNESAIKLYEQCGFKTTSIFDFYALEL